MNDRWPPSASKSCGKRTLHLLMSMRRVVACKPPLMLGHPQCKFPSLPIWRVFAFYRQLFLTSQQMLSLSMQGWVGSTGTAKKKLWTTFNDARGNTTHGCYRSDPYCAVQIWAGDSSSGWEQATTEAWKTTSLPRLELVEPELCLTSNMTTSAASMTATQPLAAVLEGDKETWQQPGWS